METCIGRPMNYSIELNELIHTIRIVVDVQWRQRAVLAGASAPASQRQGSLSLPRVLCAAMQRHKRFAPLVEDKSSLVGDSWAGAHGAAYELEHATSRRSS